MNARTEPMTLTLDSPVTRTMPIPQHSAETLTGGGSQAHILLAGQVYTLRITRAGKLILTK